MLKTAKRPEMFRGFNIYLCIFEIAMKFNEHQHKSQFEGKDRRRVYALGIFSEFFCQTQL